MNNESSFIYGETPSAVQVYAVVSLCSSEKDFKLKNGKIFFKQKYILYTNIQV